MLPADSIFWGTSPLLVDLTNNDPIISGIFLAYTLLSGHKFTYLLTYLLKKLVVVEYPFSAM